MGCEGSGFPNDDFRVMPADLLQDGIHRLGNAPLKGIHHGDVLLPPFLVDDCDKYCMDPLIVGIRPVGSGNILVLEDDQIGIGEDQMPGSEEDIGVLQGNGSGLFDL